MKTYSPLIVACILFLLSACKSDRCDELTIVDASPSSGFVFALQKGNDEDLLYPVNLNEFVDEPALDVVICAEYEESDPPFWYDNPSWCDILGLTNCPDPPDLNFIKLTSVE